MVCLTCRRFKRLTLNEFKVFCSARLSEEIYTKYESFCILCNTAVVYCVRNILRGSAISSEFDISGLSCMLCTEGSGPCGGLPILKGHVSHMLVGALWCHLCFNLVISPENCEHCSESFMKPNKFLSF